MKYAGVDIGSRTVKLVLVEDDKVVIGEVRENSFNPLEIVADLLSGHTFDKLVATGYGRHLVKNTYDCDVISEIKAFGLGVNAQYPDTRTILDIGGQDIKAIALDESGRIGKFEMNDKCSAGTGRFMEIMAMALGSSLEHFGDLALSAETAEQINSMCTVFAESEVISLMSKGARREEVALGIHQAIIGRSLNMLKRVMNGDSAGLIFVGGMALNNCIVSLIEKQLGCEIIVPPNPQLYGALGCAIQAAKLDNRKISLNTVAL